MVGLGRVELPTYGLGNRRSIQLSYSPVPRESLTRIRLLSQSIGLIGSGPHSDKRGGLNGSMQHPLKVHVQQSTKLNSIKGVDGNGTLPCLGSD